MKLLVATRNAGKMRELRDLTVGVIGASRVGREVIRLLHSYPRLKIKVFDPYLSEADAALLQLAAFKTCGHGGATAVE